MMKFFRRLYSALEYMVCLVLLIFLLIVFSLPFALIDEILEDEADRISRIINQTS